MNSAVATAPDTSEWDAWTEGLAETLADLGIGGDEEVTASVVSSTETDVAVQLAAIVEDVRLVAAALQDAGDLSAGEAVREAAKHLALAVDRLKRNSTAAA